MLRKKGDYKFYCLENSYLIGNKYGFSPKERASSVHSQKVKLETAKVAWFKNEIHIEF